jgi:hypothetical protein
VAGAPLGGEFQVGVTTVYTQRSPSVASASKLSL